MDIGITLNSLHQQGVKKVYYVNSEETLKNQMDSSTEFDESLTLLHNLYRELPDIVLFLQATGFIWYNNEKHLCNKFIIGIWFYISRLLVLFGLGLAIYDIYANSELELSETSHQSRIYDGCYLILAIAIFLQFVILIPTYYLLTLRLKRKYNFIEFNHFKSIINRCWYVFFFAVTIACIPYLISVIYHFQPQFIIFFLSQIAISGVLAVNSLFVIIDARVCVTLINDLQIISLKNELTVKNYILARNEINLRVNNSQFLNNSLIIVATVNMIAIIAVLIASFDFNNNKGSITDIFLCLKEFIILFIIIYETSQVNEKSDELTNSLCLTKYDYENQISEIERLGVALQAINQPISFTILSKRYKRWDVILQLGGLITTIITLLLKYVINQFI